jgi:hypothetical protein
LGFLGQRPEASKVEVAQESQQFVDIVLQESVPDLEFHFHPDRFKGFGREFR